MTSIESRIDPQVAKAVVETQPREKLSDAELGDLLSAMGNNEAKAIALGSMSMATIYSASDLYQMINSLQSPYKSWIMGGNVVFDYLDHSMAPIGLVAKEVVEGNSLQTVGFLKTDKGRDLGEPLAGLLLDFSLRYPDVSLIDIFGGAASKYLINEKSDRRKRAPETRYRVLQGLMTYQLPITVKSLGNNIGEDPDAVGTHAKYLSEKNIMFYRTVSRGEGKIYMTNPNSLELTLQGRGRGFKQHIIDTLNAYPDGMTVAMLADKYLEKPESSGLDKKAIEAALRKEIGELRKISAVLMPNGFDRSSITMNNEQSEMILDLIYRLEIFKEQDPEALFEWKLRLAEIISDPVSVANLLHKAKEHSPFAKRISQEATFSELKNLIATNPGLNTNQLRMLLEKRQNRLLSPSAMRALLQELREKGQIIAGSKDGLLIFSVNSEISDEI